MDNEPTTTDILEAISDFSTTVDQKFEKIDRRFDKIDGDIKSIKSTMVTKEYMDDKLADFRGDLTVIMRKENTKVKALVDLLVERRVLRDEDRKRLFSMEPFPELSM